MGPGTDRRLYAAKLALVAGSYYGAAEIGLDLAFANTSVTAVWPPTGIALAALVLWGPRMWPAVALGALLANAWSGVAWVSVGGIVLGNTLEAVAGAWLLRRVGFRPTLDRLRDVLALAVLAAAVSTSISASVGVGSLLAGDELDLGDAGSTWRTWWLGDMGGDVLVAPAIMIAASHWPFRGLPGRPLEGLALAVATIAIALVVFSQESALVYPLFPPLIWAALRFLQPGAAVASLLVAALAVAYTADGSGPFAGDDPDESLLLAQTFVSVAGLTALVLAAVLSERARAERTVEYIAGTLQESLLPSRLPKIPSIEAAAHFQPAGERYQMGGDFYDVFETGESWAIVVGDVCGKGPDAAAITALARYTLRAAAMQERRPSRVLGFLNDAILRQRATDELCTVAYVRLELENGTGRLTSSTGGHPLPLLLRTDGTVELVGEPGMALGVQSKPWLLDHVVELRPGDVLLLYTDGLTDAYAPVRTLHPEDLSALLASCAGMDALAIAERVRSEVLDVPDVTPRDDIAFLVLRMADRAEGGLMEVSVRLTSDLDAPAAARETVMALEDRIPRRMLDDVLLLTSELVSNGVRHSRAAVGAPVEVRARVFPDRIRVEVSDMGPAFDPTPREPGADLASGWGLYLVEQVANRWGIEGDRPKVVWYEIDRPA